MSTASTHLPVTDIEPASPKVKRYERAKLFATVLSLIITFLATTILALFAGPHIDSFLRSWTGNNDWVRLVALGFVYAATLELLQLPVSFWSGYILEHRYGLSNLTLAGWIWRKIKMYLIGGVLGLALLLGLYAVLWVTGAWWWLWATAGLLLVTVVLGQLLPVIVLPLFYKVTPLEDTSLLERLRRLADGTGLNIQGVYRLHLSGETKKANAALAGLGRTRRVLLGDTLLDAFTPEEIEVVFAHEVGHHVHRHIPKGIALSVVLSLAGFWLVDLVLRHAAVTLGYPAWDDPAALPLFLLVLGVFGFVLSPLQNAISRFFERQGDRYALIRTANPMAYRAAFVKLARMNMADPDPSPLVVWLFEDHPPIRQRLAMADLKM